MVYNLVYKIYYSYSADKRRYKSIWKLGVMLLNHSVETSMEKTSKNNIIPIEENRLYFLFRRGKKEHIQALYEDGELYINSIDFIRNCDDNEERSDEDDGIKFRKFLGVTSVTICDVGKDFDKDGITFEAQNTVLKNDESIKGNIFCLTGIYSDDLMGERNEIRFQTQSFGESILFIHKPKIFLERVHKELDRLGYTNHKSSKVLYYKNDYSGNVNFFMKNEKFKSQCEFRIFIPNEKNEPLRINIGSLKDIASINTGVIKLTYTDNIEQHIFL